jgi:hypothetical protein
MPLRVGRHEAPKHLARSVHRLYFEPLRFAKHNGSNAVCIVTRSLPPACPASRSF